jgi:hypothetical protein
MQKVPIVVDCTAEPHSLVYMALNDIPAESERVNSSPPTMLELGTAVGLVESRSPVD